MLQHVLSGAPIFALFLVGYILRRVKFFREETIGDIKKFVTTITLPALLFTSFLNLELKGTYLIAVVAVYLMCTLMIMIGKVVARIFRIGTPYFPLMMSGFEMGMFGYAMFISLYGIDHLGKIAFLAIGQSVFVFTILVSQLMHLRDGKQGMKEMVKGFVTSPVILAIAAGIIAGQMKGSIQHNVYLDAARTFINLLASVTVPLITITIGYGLTASREGLGLSLATIAIRKTLLVGFALLINRFIIDGMLHMGAMYRYAMLILALSPPSFILSIFARTDHTEDVHYINRTISIDSVVSIFLTMIAATIYS